MNDKGFHAAAGWFFKRLDMPAGYVVINKEATPDSPSVASVVLDDGTWASIVASVALGGETADSFAQAQRLHGTGYAGREPAAG